MQLINQVIAFNVDAVCVYIYLLHRPTTTTAQRQGSNELRRFDTSVSRRFVQTCFCYYYELWLWKILQCVCVWVELMSYRQHSSISSHNRKCAIRRHFEIYVRCGLHSIPSIACMFVCTYCILVWIVYEPASDRANEWALVVWKYAIYGRTWAINIYRQHDRLHRFLLKEMRSSHIAYETVSLCVFVQCVRSL